MATTIKYNAVRIKEIPSMESCVISMILENHKIFNPVICLFPIYMMDTFRGFKVAAKIFFNQNSVLVNIAMLIGRLVIRPQDKNISISAKHPTTLPLRMVLAGAECIRIRRFLHSFLEFCLGRHVSPLMSLTNFPLGFLRMCFTLMSFGHFLSCGFTDWLSHENSFWHNSFLSGTNYNEFILCCQAMEGN